MALPIESWEQVLGNADEDTAALILKLASEDAESAVNHTATAADADFHYARSLWSQELKEYQEIRDPGTATDGVDAVDISDDIPETLYATPATTRYATPATAPEAGTGIVRFQCVICEDQFGADDCCQVPCEHYYCDSCLNDLFRVAMTDEQAYPPRCCRTTVPFEDVQHFLDRKLATQFAAKKPELDDKKPTYCHAPTCSAYISEDFKDLYVAICPSCTKKTCLLCHQAEHEGDCAEDEAVEETLKLAESEGWQRCPGCERIVELHIGCNHMTCLCKTEFCYVCREPWKNCPCPQFDEARLLDRAQEIVDRDGEGDANEVAAGLLQHHECINDDHEWDVVYGMQDCEVCGDTLRKYIYRCTRCHTQSCHRCRFGRT